MEASNECNEGTDAVLFLTLIIENWLVIRRVQWGECAWYALAGEVEREGESDTAKASMTALHK